MSPSKHLTETAFYRQELHDSNSVEQWQAEGALDMPWRANAKWKSMLAAYQAPALDPGIDDALQAFIAQRKSEMPDAAY